MAFIIVTDKNNLKQILNSKDIMFPIVEYKNSDYPTLNSIISLKDNVTLFVQEDVCKILDRLTINPIKIAN
jgi:hypothetical protein